MLITLDRKILELCGFPSPLSRLDAGLLVLHDLGTARNRLSCCPWLKLRKFNLLLRDQSFNGAGKEQPVYYLTHVVSLAFHAEMVSVFSAAVSAVR